jgi:DNA-binding response OmpR family regulator
VKGKKVLLIDDDVNILDITGAAFRQAGAEVITAANGVEGVRRLYDHRPDLVILDIIMPKMDGWETCRQIRLLSDIPVIMLTSLKSDEEMIRGLDSGADDFVSKPFATDILLARVRAVLRRSALRGKMEVSHAYIDDYLNIDLEGRRVLVNGKLVKLTPTEFDLLAYLLQNTGRVRTFEQILENVWGWEYRDSVDYVHVYVSHLRGKIEKDPKKPAYILTEHGVGYRFESQTA